MAMAERRRAPRRIPEPHEPLVRVRLRAGRDLVVINLSNSGLWVESPVRLLPGSRVDIHVFTATGRLLTRTRVARACVGAVGPDGVLYRAALCFDQPLALETPGYPVPESVTPVAASGGTRYPNGGLDRSGMVGERTHFVGDNPG